ncbi:MAG: 50S ribosomal protein L32e [Candidatus Aenigmarchaeota archaeon]|nr:50S ribosomal protein L32e [Candidatus Aenigmarchaeota archaeon]MBU5688973.1 50S ribosomal protein L32e [Candidatus Aenigmarchaeota archaeon]
MNPRKKPKFNRHGAYVKRVSKSWRRPRGRDNKMRIKEKAKGKRPSVGFGAPKALRGLHPSGFKEILISNIKELERVDKVKEAIRIAAKVGKKKKTEIVAKAKELGIKVLNP